MKSLDQHIILITGASKGIGAAVARRLAAEGAHVVLAARNVAGLEAVDDAITIGKGAATLVPLDLAKHDDIDALGAALLEKFGRLDGLIGNAAILGQVTPLTHTTPKQWQAVMDINVTANWRLLRICEPLLRLSHHPRAAFVTSGVTQHSAPYWGAYSISKAALENMVVTYAAEMKDSKLRVNLIDPGVVATDMRAQAFPGEQRTSLMQPDDMRLTDVFVNAMTKECISHGVRLRVKH